VTSHIYYSTAILSALVSLVSRVSRWLQAEIADKNMGIPVHGVINKLCIITFVLRNEAYNFFLHHVMKELNRTDNFINARSA
jgi:hypothetical protein